VRASWAAGESSLGPGWKKILPPNVPSSVLIISDLLIFGGEFSPGFFVFCLQRVFQFVVLLLENIIE
jgi:hypothetical protein